jgi:hypothetical protein
MYKVNNAEMAKELAKEYNLSYGMSLFDGKWYVGSPEELKKIGVTDIDKSENVSKAKHIINILEEGGKDQVAVKAKGYELKADVVNPDDLFGTEDSRGPFWKDTYLLQMIGGNYVINADNDQEAIDYFIDWSEKNTPGYLFSPEEEAELEDDEREDYITGGNAGRMLNEPIMRDQMYKIDPKPLIAQHFGEGGK